MRLFRKNKLYRTHYQKWRFNLHPVYSRGVRVQTLLAVYNGTHSLTTVKSGVGRGVDLSLTQWQLSVLEDLLTLKTITYLTVQQQKKCAASKV